MPLINISTGTTTTATIFLRNNSNNNTYINCGKHKNSKQSNKSYHKIQLKKETIHDILIKYIVLSTYSQLRDDFGGKTYENGE